ncbi:MAG TPA: R3H domain-containing nucleic acid-binding protein [Baekduia sp.]|nr:R3H domain-containing nucleic acid-binding protein [Baekduia sp.]
MSERNPEAAVQELLERIVGALGLDAEVQVSTDGETVIGNLEGEDLGLFIGRRGQTIEAVQHLAQRMLVADREAPKTRVVIDAAGYRAQRAEVLHQHADEAADEALESGQPVALDAMNASERKIVHTYLAERGDVTTHSEGDEPDRHLVVSPASPSD